MKLLIADDNKEFADVLGKLVDTPECQVAGIVTCGGMGVIRAYALNRPDAVLMDCMMPRLSGISACRQIMSTDPGAKIILMSGDADLRRLEWAAKSAGALAVLHKPFATATLQKLLLSLFGAALAAERISTQPRAA